MCVVEVAARELGRSFQSYPVLLPHPPEESSRVPRLCLLWSKPLALTLQWTIPPPSGGLPGRVRRVMSGPRLCAWNLPLPHDLSLMTLSKTHLICCHALLVKSPELLYLLTYFF